jgi:hypothetical protein
MMTDATDQLPKSNQNVDYFSSGLSPLSLPTLPANRQAFPSIDYNGLQQVPRSVMITRPQAVQNTSRSNSMPSWRGSLPMKFDPLIVNQYQITPRFSQKVFLGGIPSELTEGFQFFLLSLPFFFTLSLSAELLFVLRKFGKCNIKWPKNDGLNHAMPGQFILLSFPIMIIVDILLKAFVMLSFVNHDQFVNFSNIVFDNNDQPSTTFFIFTCHHQHQHRRLLHRFEQIDSNQFVSLFSSIRR